MKHYQKQFAQHIRNGFFALAGRTLDEWLAKDAKSFEPKFHRIQLHLLNGACRLAHDAAASLLSEHDCPPNLALEAMLCLQSFALHDALIAWSEGYGSMRLMSPRDLAHAATTLSGIGAHALALRWADMGVAKAPLDPVCLVNRALILGYLGQFDKAQQDLERVVSGSRHNAMAYWVLARLRRQSADSCHVDAMRRALAASGLEAPERAFLGYALFKELDDLGDHASAWAALANASAEAALRAPYHRTAQDHLFASLKRLPVARRESAEDPIEVVGKTVPIFVVGMHRSGTSLIERILGTSVEVHDMGETNRLGAALRYGADLFCEQVPDISLLTQAARIDHRFVRKVFENAAPIQSRGRRFVTEKLTSNFLNIGFIAQAFPHAKILHMRREPIDLCFANYRELFTAPVTHANRLDDLVHYHALYEDLMRHWHETYPGLILDVHYEQLVRDPVAESKRVFAFCGLQWQPQVVSVEQRTHDPVSTLSSVQVRQPVNTASIGRWRPYAQWLGVLTDAFPDGSVPHFADN